MDIKNDIKNEIILLFYKKILNVLKTPDFNSDEFAQNVEDIYKYFIEVASSLNLKDKYISNDYVENTKTESLLSSKIFDSFSRCKRADRRKIQDMLLQIMVFCSGKNELTSATLKNTYKKAYKASNHEYIAEINKMVSKESSFNEYEILSLIFRDLVARDKSSSNFTLKLSHFENILKKYKIKSLNKKETSSHILSLSTIVFSRFQDKDAFDLIKKMVKIGEKIQFGMLRSDFKVSKKIFELTELIEKFIDFKEIENNLQDSSGVLDILIKNWILKQDLLSEQFFVRINKETSDRSFIKSHFFFHLIEHFFKERDKHRYKLEHKGLEKLMKISNIDFNKLGVDGDPYWFELAFSIPSVKHLSQADLSQKLFNIFNLLIKSNVDLLAIGAFNNDFKEFVEKKGMFLRKDEEQYNALLSAFEKVTLNLETKESFDL